MADVVDVEYGDGATERYFVPLAARAASEALVKTAPAAAVARIPRPSIGWIPGPVETVERTED